MVDVSSLAGVYARHPLFQPSNMVCGFTADYIKDINDEGELTLHNEAGRVDTVEAGNWLPIYKPSAIPTLKSISVLPLNGQMTSATIRPRVTVPTYYCEQVFANSVLRWYRRVGNFVAPPGLIVVPSQDLDPYARSFTFTGISVLPAVAFSNEGDAVLWSLMAFEQGGDLFKDPSTTKLSLADQETIKKVNLILTHPENYFG